MSTATFAEALEGLRQHIVHLNAENAALRLDRNVAEARIYRAKTALLRGPGTETDQITAALKALSGEDRR